MVYVSNNYLPFTDISLAHEAAKVIDIYPSEIYLQNFVSLLHAVCDSMEQDMNMALNLTNSEASQLLTGFLEIEKLHKFRSFIKNGQEPENEIQKVVLRVIHTYLQLFDTLSVISSQDVDEDSDEYKAWLFTQLSNDSQEKIKIKDKKSLIKLFD